MALDAEKFRAGIGRGWASITNWLLPRRCLLCSAPADHAHLCSACWQDLPRIKLACPQCARPVISPGCCASCVQHPPPYEHTIAPLVYAGSAQYLLTQFKFHGRLSHATPLHTALRAALEASDSPKPQAILPVPIHPRRLAERGFNQAVELARPLAHALHIPLILHAVVRQRATQPQVGLKAEARAANLRGAFAVRSGAVFPEHVAIVDDVLTSGATVGELASLLHQHGVRRVEVWCALRAE